MGWAYFLYESSPGKSDWRLVHGPLRGDRWACQMEKNYQTTRRDHEARDASAHLESVSAAQQTHVLNFALPCAQRLRPTDFIRMCPDSATFISTHIKQA